MSGRALVILSQRGVDFIKGFESFSAKPYRCPGGHWTNGWGHTRGVTENSAEVDLETAEDNFFDDVEIVEAELDALFDGIEFSSGQWDALVSLCFNLKGGPRRLPTVAPKMVQAIREARWEDAAQEFLDMGNAEKGGKLVPLKGLVRRRKAEARMFLEKEQP